MLERPTTVGRAISGQEIRILDAAGSDLPVGETGLIYIRKEAPHN